VQWNGISRFHFIYASEVCFFFVCLILQSYQTPNNILKLKINYSKRFARKVTFPRPLVAVMGKLRMAKLDLLERLCNAKDGKHTNTNISYFEFRSEFIHSKLLCI